MKIFFLETIVLSIFLLLHLNCSSENIEHDNIVRVDPSHDALMHGKMEEFCCHVEAGFYCMPHDVFHILECPSNSKIKCTMGTICAVPMGIKLPSPICEPLEIPDL